MTAIPADAPFGPEFRAEYLGPRRYRVTIDGVELDKCTAFEVSNDVGSPVSAVSVTFLTNRAAVTAHTPPPALPADPPE